MSSAGDSDRGDGGGPDAENPSSTPEQPDPLDVDAAFAAIIAGWADDTPGNWPAEEDVPAGGRHRRDDPAQTETDDGATSNSSQDGPAGSGREDGPLIPSLDLPLDEPIELRAETKADRYAPPEPPPLPRGDALSRLAWAGVIGGPIFLLITVIIWRTAPQLLVLASVAAFVAGFITLVARMPKHRSDDDDDGAVV
jgi:hypothetical protein